MRDTLDEWIYYLKTSELPEVYHAQGLDEVEKQLNLDQMDPETKSKYMEMLQGLNVSEDVLTSYWKEGLAEGERRALESTVVRMFKSGLDIDRIAQIQEISRADVESILS